LTSGTGTVPPTQHPSRLKAEGYVSLQPFRLIIEARQRKEFSDIQGMMDSLKRFGQIQPIVVVKAPEKGDDWFRLIAGERRTRAAIMLGWKSIPYVLKEHLDPILQKEIELEENVRRSNLTMMEEANALLEIDDLKRKIHGETGGSSSTEQGWSIEKTAQLVNQPASTVQRKIKVARAARSDPKLAALVANLPLAAAARHIEQHKKTQKAERQHANGTLKLDTSLREGDSRELIKAVADASVGMVLTDPPFGIDEIEDSRQKGGGGDSQVYTATLKASDNLDLDSAVKLMDDLSPELFRVCKPGAHIYIFCSTTLAPFIYQSLEKAGFECQKSLLIWNKMRTTTPSRGYEYASSYEPIVFGWKPPRTRMLNLPSANILSYSPLHATKKLHRFEKPGKLIQFLINQSSTMGDLIFDPFAGSARTLLEAKRLNRSALGFELDHENYLQAQTRLVVPMLSEDDENGK
jgi:ParB/RepB/Spo0J family partition protein